MNQGIAYEVAGVMAQAVATGLFVSLCTIQAPPTAPNPDGTQPATPYVNVAGLMNIPCQSSVLLGLTTIDSTEKKTTAEQLAVTFRHVLLNGFYPAIQAGVGLGWRAVVDGTDFDLIAAEPDSQSQMTRLKIQLATV